MSAKTEQVSQIHEDFANELADQLKNGTVVATKDRDGNTSVERVSPNAALLNVVRQFLRDCGVGVDAENLPASTRAVATNLADLEDDDFPQFPN